MNDNPIPHAYVVVYSTSQAIKIEKLLQERSITSKLVPVPRQISSDCGVCLQIEGSDIDAVEEILSQALIEVQGIFH